MQIMCDLANFSSACKCAEMRRLREGGGKKKSFEKCAGNLIPKIAGDGLTVRSSDVIPAWF
jgi:hypothetical protein